mmetsp:Transcript_31328/g.71521  ORF Transcript_31328/g.71521 Transcript_31328/m.71521 type:complete len:730 (-) Transcript_31328:10-2199(-)
MSEQPAAPAKTLRRLRPIQSETRVLAESSGGFEEEAAPMDVSSDTDAEPHVKEVPRTPPPERSSRNIPRDPYAGTKAKRRRPYSAEDYKAASHSELLVTLMSAADHNSNKPGGSHRWKELINTVRKLLPEAYHQRLEEIVHGFKSNTASTYNRALDGLIQDIQRGKPENETQPANFTNEEGWETTPLISVEAATSTRDVEKDTGAPSSRPVEAHAAEKVARTRKRRLLIRREYVAKYHASPGCSGCFVALGGGQGRVCPACERACRTGPCVHSCRLHTELCRQRMVRLLRADATRKCLVKGKTVYEEPVGLYDDEDKVQSDTGTRRRRFPIRKYLVDRFGKTPGCSGCSVGTYRSGSHCSWCNSSPCTLGCRRHTEECRHRMELCLQSDDVRRDWSRRKVKLDWSEPTQLPRLLYKRSVKRSAEGAVARDDEAKMKAKQQDKIEVLTRLRRSGKEQREDGIRARRADKRNVREAMKVALLEQARNKGNTEKRNVREAMKAALLEQVRNKGRCLRHASKSFRKNREIVKAAVAQDGTALRFAAKALQADVDIVQLAVESSSGRAYKYARGLAKCDKGIALTAVEHDKSAAKHVARELFRHQEVAESVISAIPSNFPYAPDEFVLDTDFAVEARKQYHILEVALTSGRRCALAFGTNGQEFPKTVAQLMKVCFEKMDFTLDPAAEPVFLYNLHDSNGPQELLATLPDLRQVLLSYGAGKVLDCFIVFRKRQ